MYILIHSYKNQGTVKGLYSAWVLSSERLAGLQVMWLLSALYNNFEINSQLYCSKFIICWEGF